MGSSVSPKDEIWFLRVCHHVSNEVYSLLWYNVARALTFYVSLFSAKVKNCGVLSTFIHTFLGVVLSNA